MKKIKNALLSVLLFSFTFLVVHDYVIADLGIASYQEYSLTEDALIEPISDNLVGVSHFHDSIHTMITTDSTNILITTLVECKRLSYVELMLATNYNSVLERPPLS